MIIANENRSDYTTTISVKFEGVREIAITLGSLIWSYERSTCWPLQAESERERERERYHHHHYTYKSVNEFIDLYYIMPTLPI